MVWSRPRRSERAFASKLLRFYGLAPQAGGRCAHTRLNQRLLGAALPIILCTRPSHAQELEIHRLQVKSYLDFGHLVSGTNEDAAPENRDIEMLPLNRGNVSLLQSVNLGNFSADVGVTGLIWWPFSENAIQPNERVMRVKPMVPLARGKWTFGERDGTGGALQFGTFPYKYNPEARNLGEYLYRSGTYPGFLWTTEGWLLLDRAGQYAHGAQLQFRHLGGKLTHNFSLFMEMVYFPIGDFSPGYDFSFRLPYLEVGGGIVLNHFLPIRPSLLEPKIEANTYVSVTGSNPLDSTYFGPKDYAPDAPDSLVVVLDRWTHRGIKLMGRVTLDFNAFLPEEKKSPEDLKLFAEAAVLGWKNYPLYYEKRAERIPVMFGLNIPAFGTLDVLSLQFEYYKSPYNDITAYNTESKPFWTIEELNTYADSAKRGPQALENWKAEAANHDDDWKWSLYAKKRFSELFSATVQVASDHFRLVDQDLAASPVPLTTRPSEWYYLVRLEFNIR